MGDTILFGTFFISRSRQYISEAEALTSFLGDTQDVQIPLVIYEELHRPWRSIHKNVFRNQWQLFVRICEWETRRPLPANEVAPASTFSGNDPELWLLRKLNRKFSSDYSLHSNRCYVFVKFHVERNLEYVRKGNTCDRKGSRMEIWDLWPRKTTDPSAVVCRPLRTTTLRNVTFAWRQWVSIISFVRSCCG